MNNIFKKALAVGIVAMGLGAGTAQATFISGSIAFSDGGITLSNLPTSMVSSLLSITLGSAGTTGCQGTANFATAPGVCTSATISPASPMLIPPISGPMTGSFSFVGVGGDVYTFTFGTVPAILPVNRVGNHDVGLGLIKDHIDFQALGTVSDSLGNFQTTIAALSFSADGTCNNSSGGVTCDVNTASASWNATLNALGRNAVPEPATLGLLGIALAGLGFSRRRRKQV